MSGDVCATEQVTLQENGIVRNAQGTIIGHLVADLDELCATHNKIGYKQGYRAGAKDAREDCANLCEELGGTIYIGGRSQGADYCAAKIRERGVQ